MYNWLILLIIVAELLTVCQVYIAIREITLLQEGNTPLHIACENGDTKTAQLLIKKGADLHQRNRVCYF